MPFSPTGSPARKVTSPAPLPTSNTFIPAVMSVCSRSRCVQGSYSRDGLSRHWISSPQCLNTEDVVRVLCVIVLLLLTCSVVLILAAGLWGTPRQQLPCEETEG